MFNIFVISLFSVLIIAWSRFEGSETAPCPFPKTKLSTLSFVSLLQVEKFIILYLFNYLILGNTSGRKPKTPPTKRGAKKEADDWATWSASAVNNFWDSEY